MEGILADDDDDDDDDDVKVSQVLIESGSRSREQNLQ